MRASAARPEPLAALGHRALAVAPELYVILRLVGSRDTGPRIRRKTWKPLPAAR